MTTHFTKKQIQQARQADLFSYLQANEPGVLKKDGRNYRHREHDSLVYVTAKNFWYWNSRGKSITALDYLMEIMGFFSSAVNTLQILVIALGAGLGAWGVVNLLEGYGNDNPGANAHVR